MNNAEIYGGDYFKKYQTESPWSWWSTAGDVGDRLGAV